MKLNAWVYGTVRDLHIMDQEQLSEMLVICKGAFGERWTLVGTVDVKLSLLSPNDMVANQVATLRKQIDEARDQADRTIAACEDKIRSLQCLTMESK